MSRKKQKGFSLVEAVIAMVILLVGILATLAAISFSILYVQEAEKMTVAKEHARSTMETIFSIRDLQLFDDDVEDGTYNWNSIVVKAAGNSGIFLSGWRPIRESPGADGVFGTSDDACALNESCGSSSPVADGYERKIEITDINENGTVRKRYVVVRVRYWVNQKQREISQSTIIVNLPAD